MSLSLTIFGYPGNLSKLHITAYLLISIGIFAVHLHDFHLRSSPQTLVFTKVASAEALQRREVIGVITHYPAGCRIIDFPGFYGFRTIKHYSALPHTYSLQKRCNPHLFVAILTSLKQGLFPKIYPCSLKACLMLLSFLPQ